jgi:hypothetical protein
MDCLVKEAFEIQLNANNITEDIGFILSQTWYPLANMLIKKQGQAVRALYSAHDHSLARDQL